MSRPATPTDTRLAAAVRHAELALYGSDVQVADRIRTMVATSLEHLLLMVGPAVTALAELAAMGYELVPTERRSCRCLCQVHRPAGYFCTGDASQRLTVTGGLLSPAQVVMCERCAVWWCTAQRSRVADVVPVLPGGWPVGGPLRPAEAAVGSLAAEDDPL